MKWPSVGMVGSEEKQWSEAELEFERASSAGTDAPDALLVRTSANGETIPNRKTLSQDDVKLVVVFSLLVLVGAANVVFTKLQAVPMHNYANFLNLFGTFLYIPLTWAYILPVYKYQWFGNAISTDQLAALPKRPFAIMGCLDCLATVMWIFSSIYLPGPLLILLPQAAIPISMMLSKMLLGHRYRKLQYVGALVVLLGILVVLEPMVTHRHAPDYYCQALDQDRDCSICQVETNRDGCLSHRLDVDPVGWLFRSQRDRLWDYDDPDEKDDDGGEGRPVCKWVDASITSNYDEEVLMLIWSLVLILSCIPMTLSSIYKEIALGEEAELDPVYLYGWVAIFQFGFSVLLAVPAGLASSPQVFPMDVPANIYNGLRCYLGTGSIETGCHPDDMCPFHAALYTNVALLTNIAFNILMIYMLKFGSASILYLALTAMVPVGNLAFAFPFLPTTTTFHLSDLVALGVIMVGLVLYRASEHAPEPRCGDEEGQQHQQGEEAQQQQQPHRATEHHAGVHWQLREPLLVGDV